MHVLEKILSWGAHVHVTEPGDDDLADSQLMLIQYEAQVVEIEVSESPFVIDQTVKLAIFVMNLSAAVARIEGVKVWNAVQIFFSPTILPATYCHG